MKFRGSIRLQQQLTGSNPEQMALNRELMKQEIGFNIASLFGDPFRQDYACFILDAKTHPWGLIGRFCTPLESETLAGIRNASGNLFLEPNYFHDPVKIDSAVQNSDGTKSGCAGSVTICSSALRFSNRLSLTSLCF